MPDKFRKEMEFFEEILVELSLGAKVTIFLDENILQLKEGLKDYGFKVIVLEKGKSDDEIKQMAYGWCILTQNSKDFIKDAVEYNYDVIAIENIKFIDDEKSRKNQTVQKIAKAMNESNIARLKANFLLKIKDDGKWTASILNEKFHG